MLAYVSDALKLAVVMTPMAAYAALPSDIESAPYYEILAETSDGQVHVAGSGDSCRTAWEDATLPADWSTVYCVEKRD